ncbi:hypothetical protein BDY21DRAFT_115152 [Lineolata rhizophorae]|uniref:Uncharacterized protein n=1 Tax=Lineolata rhizophorae TaxID=578093 RepID=A0A6A6NQB5_9PEZI|nr:hypothetical protein BDY21DRAFT_115152 [Lineolata rhizophorae]
MALQHYREPRQGSPFVRSGPAPTCTSNPSHSSRPSDQPRSPGAPSPRSLKTAVDRLFCRAGRRRKPELKIHIPAAMDGSILHASPPPRPKTCDQRAIWAEAWE